MFQKCGPRIGALRHGVWLLAYLSAGPATNAHADTVDIQISNFHFSPATVNIKAGDTVRWTWVNGGHSVTSGSSCVADGNFNSGVQGQGATFTQTFSTPGQIPYFCTPHCSSGMTGVVNVAAAATTPDPGTGTTPDPGIGTTPDPATGTAGKKLPKKLMLQFKTMYGVDGPLVGDANPVRGVIGDELPWTVRNSATGQLFSNGLLIVKVRGLVFPNDPSVPVEKRLINDEASFRGLVSCLTEDNGQTITRNVMTDAFLATKFGNATIRTTLNLPNPCIAPIVMIVAGSEDKWFAITGFEAPQ